MNKVVSLKKTFANPYFSYMEDAVDLQFVCDAGFASELEAYACVARFGLNPAHFLYVQFCGNWYAVSISESGFGQVLGKSRVWVTDSSGAGIKMSYLKAMSEDEQKSVLTPNIPLAASQLQPFTEQLVWDMEELNQGPLEIIYDPSLEDAPEKLYDLQMQGQLLLGRCLVLPVPVFQMDVFYGYFDGDIPGYDNWKKGFETFNPFQKVGVRKDKSPYCLNRWVQTLQSCGAKINGQLPAVVVNTLSAAWQAGKEG